MSIINVNLNTLIRRTFRVEQVAGMFDVPMEVSTLTPALSQREREPTVRHELTAEVPGLDEEWTIGVIVGPSGSGKTTLARAAFGEAVYEPKEWPDERAIVDVLGEGSEWGAGAEYEIRNAEWPADGRWREAHSIKDLARVLTAVGLGSVPTWLKPYRVLSTGERFRADLARAILQSEVNLTQRPTTAPRRCPGAEGGRSDVLRASAPLREHSGLVVFDEFASTLDRTVAKTLSAALSRLLRSSTPRSALRARRFVAITCHADIVPWLAPDWVLDLGDASGAPVLTRGQVPRPRIRLRIERVPQSLWRRFARYHYLTGGMAASATCYGAWWEGEEVGSGECGLRSDGTRSVPTTVGPVAFCAVVAALGWKSSKRITRLVTLPEFQGLGIGTRLAEAVAAGEAARGFRVTITASHPAILAHCSHSPRWRYLGLKKNGSTRQRYGGREIRCSTGRAVASFEFVREG